MSTKLLNGYEATYAGGAKAKCNAQTMEEAAKILSDETEPSILQKVAAGIRVSVPDPALAFTTSVENEAAYTAGCRAYPKHGGQVKAGDTVFLSAVAAEGYSFVGWYQGATKLSDDAETAVVVESASPVPAIIVYEAHFEAI
jgi:hypothetical protein